MKKSALSLVSSFILLSLTFMTGPAAGAQSLDSTFGVQGKVEVSFGVSIAPSDAALQPDGKIVVVGTTNNFQIASQVFGVARFLANGSLDTTFGNQGSAITAFTNFINTPNAVALQLDGKIIVAGETQSSDGTINRFAVTRFNPDGSLDTSFASGGKSTPEFFGTTFGGSRELAAVVLLQPDNKIIVAGVAIQGARMPAKSALVRFNPDGTLDSTFGTGGKVAVNSIGLITSLALLSDGRILALNNVGGIAQFSPSGQLASSVTSGTIATTSNTGLSAFETNGRFRIAGGTRGATLKDVDLTGIGFNPTGSIDGTFKSPAFDFGNEDPTAHDVAQVVAIQSDGKLVIGGFSSGNAGVLFGLARLNTNGSLDNTFGNGGVLTLRFEGSDQVSSIIIQPDGKILAIGEAFNSNANQANLAMARFQP